METVVREDDQLIHSTFLHVTPEEVVVTSHLIGQEVEITNNEDIYGITIPVTISDDDVVVHDGIAAETVVTTTYLYNKPLLKDDSTDSGCSMEDLEEGSEFTHENDSDPTLGELDCDDPLHPQYGGTSSWSALEMSKFKSDLPEDLSSSDGFVALMPDPVITEEAVSGNATTHEASIREITKREQDRIKKKILRENPAYRQKESDKAKARMKLRRLDPVYRANERQRDRQRRKASRQRDITGRVREKERDKEYKRQKRVEVNSMILPIDDFEDVYHYGSVIGGAIDKSQIVENVTTQTRETFDGT